MPDREIIKAELDEIMDAARAFDYVSFSAILEHCVNILNLLKEQEPCEPEKEHSGSGVTWWNVCGNCKTAINPNDKYCHECGRAVKWNA